MPRFASGRRIREGAESNASRTTDELASIKAGRRVTLHWTSTGDGEEWKRSHASIETAVADLVDCQPRPFAIATLDSLMHRRLMLTTQLDHLLSALPARHSVIRRLLDARAEEGIESVARVLLADAGIVAEPQVGIRGIGRVDLLVDGWLVIELDGRETHAQKQAFTKDRRRVSALVASGRVALQFSYAQVIYEPQEVVSQVAGALASAPSFSRRFPPSAG